MEKVCIAIPSYKRSKCITARRLSQDCPYDKYICVRPEELADYQEVAAETGCKLLPLENVTDIGNTRQRIVEELSKEYEWMFLFDDDIYSIEMLGQRDGVIKSQRILRNTGEKPRIETEALKLWFDIAAIRNDYVYSSVDHRTFDRGNHGFISINRSSLTEVVLVHLPSILKVGNYRSNYEVGFEDMYIQYKLMRAGFLCARLGMIEFSATPAGKSPKGGCNENIYKDGMAACNKIFTEGFLNAVKGEDISNLIKLKKRSYPDGSEAETIDLIWKNWGGSKTKCQIPEI